MSGEAVQPQRRRVDGDLPVYAIAAPAVEHRGGHVQGPLVALALGALGVVYGDIGTSPLYALRECFVGEHALAVTAPNVLGIL